MFTNTVLLPKRDLDFGAQVCYQLCRVDRLTSSLGLRLGKRSHRCCCRVVWLRTPCRYAFRRREIRRYALEYCRLPAWSSVIWHTETRRRRITYPNPEP